MISTETVLVNDLETRFLEGGSPDNPTVVFLHDGAWGASSDVTWGDVLPLAAESFHVVAVDMLGFGGSAKAVRLDQAPFGFRLRHVLALLDRLGVTEPVHLVGNSFGGSVALRALTVPELRDRIASVTTISGTGGPWRTAAGAALGRFDGTREDTARIVGLLCDDFEGLEDQVDRRHAWAKAPGHFAATMAIHTPVPEPLKFQPPADSFPASLSGVDTPVLLFECVRDALVERGWTKHLVDVLEHCDVVEIDHMHSPNISHPQETWAHIEGFLARQADPVRAR
ncbi:alpha/beta fold hydrolase [Aeromicrobium choanae]|uniref:Pimeloyl-ACP methyl ester carboxylesterase n=1 Tax=Aeromicrobium choanae TaxID=1736691 RepID=A0A1T4Z5U2_9ACTN|nr:alpha/beta hydrolase [Aeromicrobium choanae]SKB08941.1 Pimeloyl-ACP methyl ester carboxylesterase [Aeromicrobium choanae]